MRAKCYSRFHLHVSVLPNCDCSRRTPDARLTPYRPFCLSVTRVLFLFLDDSSLFIAWSRLCQSFKHKFQFIILGVPVNTHKNPNSISFYYSFSNHFSAETRINILNPWQCNAYIKAIVKQKNGHCW